MIARGSSDESEARRYVGYWEAMIGHWNVEADSYRQAARGRTEASLAMLEEADRARLAIQEAVALCDTLTDNLPPGHELMGALLQIGSALAALDESIAISADQLIPRVEARQDIAQLKYLVSIIRQTGATSLPGN